MYISIGIPFYNAEKFLLNAIKSVFAQTHTKWELILIDDGSTDNSLKIAKSINDSRVRVISDGKNKKLASRLNEIVQLAKYDLIARMDADDLMSPTRLEKQLNILIENQKIDLVTTGLFSVTDDLKPIGIRWHQNTSITFNEVIQKKGCGVVHAAILAKKDWFLRNKYNQSLKIAQDFELWVRTYYKNDFKIHLLQEPLYYYREESSATAKKMLMAYKYDRTVFNNYAGKQKIQLILKSFLKSLIVSILNKINRMDLILNKRSNTFSDKKLLEKFNSELKIIKNTIIPLK